MPPLLAQLLAIAAAPLVARVLAGRPRATSFAEAAVLVLVAGTLVLHVLPEGLRSAGVAALLALILGFTAGISSHRVPGGQGAARAMAGVALAVHGLFDGAALGSAEHGDLLAWAVVLHTVPVSLAVWQLAHRAGGRALGVTMLAVTAASTLLGFLVSSSLVAGASAAARGVVQCAMAGALLHVVGHLPARSVAPWSGIGGVAGLLLLGALTLDDPVPGAATAALRLLGAASPGLLLAWAAMGALHVVEQGPASVVEGGSRWASAARGALAGARLPLTACGVLPVYRSLVARGTSPSGAVAFLVSGTGVGLSTLAVSLSLLGVADTAVRVLAATALAVVVAAVVGPRVRRAPSRPPLVRPRREGRARVAEAARFAFGEAVDHLGPWLVAGLVVGALADATLPSGAFGPWSRPLVVVAAALAGLPSYVCATGATPLVAALMGKGLGLGAALAFLLTGPAANVATFSLLRRLHGTRTAVLYAAVVTAGAVGLGLGVDRLDLPPPTPPGAPGPIGLACAAVLTALVGASFFRRGPAGFAEPLLHPHHDHEPPADHPFVRSPGAGPGAPVLVLPPRDPR